MSSDLAPTVAVPTETLYVRNLNEKVNLNKLKRTLKAEFEQYGNIIDVIAHKNLRLKGQAFIVFETADGAQKALAAKGSTVLGRPLDITFARTRSDASVKRNGTETEFEQHKSERLERKEERKRKLAEQEQANTNDNDDKEQKKPKKGSKKSKEATGELSTMPPNRILFVENLPAGSSTSDLEPIFSRFPGFIEIRMVPLRKLAFAEYETDEQAAEARSATLGLELDDSIVKITFAKK